MNALKLEVLNDCKCLVSPDVLFIKSLPIEVRNFNFIAVENCQRRLVTAVDFGCTTVRAEIDYRHPAQMGDRREVSIWITAVGRRSVTTRYRIYDETGRRLIAEAQTVQVISLAGDDRDAMTNNIEAVLLDFVDPEIAGPANSAT